MEKKVPNLNSVYTMALETIEDRVRILQALCHNESYNAGWYMNPKTGEPYTHDVVPEKIALIHSEVSEALEGHRKDKMDDKLPHRPMIEVELADAIIRILDLGGFLNLDVAGAIIEKMKFNSTRPDHQLENRKAEGGKKF